MRSLWPLRRVLGAVVVPAALVAGCIAPPEPVGWQPTDQGFWWTPRKRFEFYSRDQGSRIIRMSWIKALELDDGRPFLHDNLKRYGFLANEDSDLPVGFNVAGKAPEQMLGMTCAACHTRQITYADTSYRIDGGPAIIDFQSFLYDLDVAVGRIIKDTTAFENFAAAVLGPGRTPDQETGLKKEVYLWHLRYHALIDGSLPRDQPWGLGRVDALGMIFNRLTGLDLGPEDQAHIIPENIKRADAPVRYPFLWNVYKESKTQWPGIAPNELRIHRHVRNVGQVLGVFGEFAPKKDPDRWLKVNYARGNSVEIGSVRRLEALTSFIDPPVWPWALDRELAKQGATIYKREKCDTCHEVDVSLRWNTQVLNVDTDSRQLHRVERSAKTGSLEGASIPLIIDGRPLGKEDLAKDILALAAVGTLVQKSFGVGRERLRPYSPGGGRRGGTVPGYEARRLYGVWAAAPYLHNGSVPTLHELLTDPDNRTPTFQVGPVYDPTKVGLARDQGGSGSTRTTTGCDQPASGNSRCGHKFGTDLDEPSKKALIEYLKTL